MTDVPPRSGEQLQLARMPVRLFSCTPSKLSAFDCPRRYRFTYLDRPPPPRGAPWAHNSVGAVVHLALHQWWSLPPAHRTPDEGARLVEQNWQNIGFRDDTQSLQASVTAGAWVAQYLAAGSATGPDGDQRGTGVDPRAEPVGVERTVATRTDRLALSGRVDRIDQRGDELVIVDYKTGRRPLSDDDARGSQALALYALGAQRTMRRSCTRVELHHLPSGTVSAFEHTEQSLARHLDRAEQTAADIVTATDTLAAGADADEVFPAAPSPVCSWCDFRSSCPEGRAASRRLDPWAGLGAELAGPDAAGD